MFVYSICTVVCVPVPVSGVWEKNLKLYVPVVLQTVSLSVDRRIGLHVGMSRTLLAAGNCFQLVQCEVIVLALIKITLAVEELFAETGLACP